MKKLNNKGQAFTTVLVVILLIISMGSLAYIIYDKVVTKDNNQKPDNTGNNTTVVNKEVKVETATEYEYKNNDAVFKVKLPKIVNGGEASQILNKKILDEILKHVPSDVLCNETMSPCFNKGLTTTYEYLVKNDVVALYIYTVLPEGGKGAPASGNGLYNDIYFYNIKTDKIIEKYSEAARLMEVQDLGLAKDYDDLDNYGCITPKPCENLNNIYACVNGSITNGTLKFVAEEQCV